MKSEREVLNYLLTELKLKYLLSGVLLGSIIIMITYEIIKEMLFIKLTNWTSHYIITIGFVSLLVTILAYFIVKYYRSLWLDIKKERDKFAAYIESAPYGVFVTDGAGNFLDINQTAVNLTGYSRQELLDLNFSDLHPPAWRSKAKQAFERVKTEGLINRELLCVTKQNRRRWFKVKVINLSADRTLGFVEDITDRKETMQELKMKDKAIQESATAFAFGYDRRIKEVNDAFLELWGYDSEKEVLNLPPQNFYSSRVKEQGEEIIKHVKNKGGRWQGEFTVQRADGTEFEVYVSATAMKNQSGAVEGIMASFIDLSDLKQTEKELRNVNQKLIEQIKSAKELHNQLLPREFPEFDGVFMAGLYQPAERIGGDFYYTVELEEEVVFYLADITGHSLDGAFLNVFLRETINNYLFYTYRSQQELSPAAVAEFIAARYREEGFTADYFISLVLFVMNKETKQVKYTNFGFQVLPLMIKSGEVDYLNLTGLPISTAVAADKYDFKEETFYLESGDKLIITTDGLTEEERAGARYGNERLKQVIDCNQQLPSEFFLQAVKSDFEKFMGAAVQQDDVSILALERVEIIDEFEMTIASDYELIEAVEEQFEKFIINHYKEVNQLLMGLHEILINAIEHGNQEEEWRQVKVKTMVTEEYLKIEVLDEGSGFKWQEALTEDMSRNDHSERGWGIVITEAVFDEVCYNQAGNKAVLYKK